MKPLKFDRRSGLSCGVLALASLLLHARSLGFDFVDFDDLTVVLGHPNLYDETSFTSSLFEIFVGYLPREEPLLLRDVSWALDARLFGFDNPFGYHLGNVVLNALNVCLLFLFLYRSTRRYDLALMVAGTFAVLPVHVEPVSWVMGRKDVLSACFVLLALLAQTAELARPTARSRWWFYGLGLLFTGMALLSKMGALALVPVLALHRMLLPDLNGTRAPGEPFAFFAALRASALELAPHALLTTAVVIWYGRTVAAFGVTGWRGLGPSDPEHLANVARFAPLIVGNYLKQVFFPDQPSLYYRWPHVEIPLTGIEMLVSLLLAVSILAAVVYCAVRRRDLAFYALAFLAFLIPYLNIVYVGIWSADRYVYLSSFCLLAIAASLLLQLQGRARGRLRMGLLAVPVAFGLSGAAYTLQHQGVWRDTESLWAYEAYRDEPSLLAIQGLAKLYMKRAAAERDPEARASLIAASRNEIARGFERERALGRVTAPYATSEQLQLSQFHYLLGRLAMIEGAPVPLQIEHFQASHAVAPSRSNTLMLAGAYFDLGNRSDAAEREKLLNRSLDYFLEYMAFSAADRVVHEKELALLAQNYEQRFPFLHDRIGKARETMTP